MEHEITYKLSSSGYYRPYYRGKRTIAIEDKGHNNCPKCCFHRKCSAALEIQNRRSSEIEYIDTDEIECTKKTVDGNYIYYEAVDLERKKRIALSSFLSNVNDKTASKD